MMIEVARGVIAILRAQARAAHPRECCGLLLGADGQIAAAVPCANVAHDPLRQFEIDAGVLIAAHRTEREGGERVAGYYHSHPLGHAQPSPRDQVAAARDGRVWAIVAGDDITLWRDEAEGFQALSYALIDG